MSERAPILIVDDNYINLRLASVTLSVEGFRTLTAVDADEARELIADAAPALILMDLQLPGMDGLDLTRLLKSDERTRGIPIVAMTAYAMKGDEARALEAGCDGYISKPIDTSALANTVRTFLERARA